MSSETRPPRAYACLEWVADHLDITDVAIRQLAELTGYEGDVVTGDDVQRDLRSMAAWLRDHPDVDANLIESLDKAAVTTPTTPAPRDAPRPGGR